MKPAEQPTQFDKTARIGLRLPVSDRVIELSYPTDEQWEAWRRRLTSRDGITFENPRATKELLTHLNGGVPLNLDDADAKWALQQLSDFLSRATCQGGIFTLDCAVFGGIKTSFKVKGPTLKRMDQYLEEETLRENVGGETVQTHNVDVQKELADELVLSWDGYVGQPPLGHKVSAAMRVILEVHAMSQSRDRGFFVTPPEPASATSPSGSSAAGEKATSTAAPTSSVQPPTEATAQVEAKTHAA